MTTPIQKTEDKTFQETGSTMTDSRTGNAFTKGNSLGTLLRHRRKSLDLTLADVSSKINCSLSLISKAELGQLPDGPTLNLLENLAIALNMDIVQLVEMKQQDAQYHQEMQTPSADAEHFRSQLERRMLYIFRTLDDQAQQHLVGEAQFIHSLRERGRGLSATATFIAGDAYAVGLPSIPEHIAHDWEVIASKYDACKRHEEAIAYFGKAQDIYEQGGLLGKAARTWFMKGKIFNHLARYDENHRAERLQLSRLEDADFCFQQTQHFFAQAESHEAKTLLGDEEKQYIPENLRQWAINDAHTGRVRAKENTAESGYGDEHNYYHAILRHYQSKGDHKRQQSLAAFVLWIDELQSKLYNVAADAAARDQRRVMSILAQTLHRAALLRSNIAAENIRYLKALSKDTNVSSKPNLSDVKSSKIRVDEAQSLTQKAVEQSPLFRELFLQAINLRRKLALTATTQTERDESLNRLANDHQALAYAVQYYTQPVAPLAQHEEALYTFLLARNINALLPADYDPGQNAAIARLIETIEQDNPLSDEMQVVIRHRVEARIEAANLGTREHPLLDYDVEYFPTTSSS